MSSVTNVNTFLGSNPLGSKVRALERDVAELKKVVEELRAKGSSAAAPAAAAAAVPTATLEEVAALRKMVEELKAAGGVVGPAGPAGPAGPTGPAGPMTYIAMPPGAMPSIPVAPPS